MVQLKNIVAIILERIKSIYNYCFIVDEDFKSTSKFPLTIYILTEECAACEKTIQNIEGVVVEYIYVDKKDFLMMVVGRNVEIISSLAKAIIVIDNDYFLFNAQKIAQELYPKMGESNAKRWQSVVNHTLQTLQRDVSFIKEGLTTNEARMINIAATCLQLLSLYDANEYPGGERILEKFNNFSEKVQQTLRLFLNQKEYTPLVQLAESIICLFNDSITDKKLKTDDNSTCETTIFISHALCDNLQDLCNYYLMPILRALKDVMYESSFYFKSTIDPQNGKGFVLYLFSSESITEHTIYPKIYKFVNQKYSIVEQQKLILFPYTLTTPFADRQEIQEIIKNVLTSVSLEVVKLVKESNFSEKYKLPYAIYAYLTSGITLFKNRETFSLFCDYYFNKNIGRCAAKGSYASEKSFSMVYNRSLSEFSKLFIQHAPQFYKNYSTLIINWGYEENNFTTVLKSLQGVIHYLKDDANTTCTISLLQYYISDEIPVENKKLWGFSEIFFDSLFDTFCVDSYQKTYTIYAVNTLLNEKV
ncbi:MAG: hypothetical protein LBK47_01235 [Prevotellaceae bacterium]|jgi:exonuclease III|nr:hypothetical protein [Prevotellaceae bacterium]